MGQSVSGKCSQCLIQQAADPVAFTWCVFSLKARLAKFASNIYFKGTKSSLIVHRLKLSERVYEIAAFRRGALTNGPRPIQLISVTFIS